MRRTLDIASVLLFVNFLVLPLGCLVAFGPVEPYGEKLFTEFPTSIRELLGDADTGRKRMASALFERSPATRMALVERYRFLYSIVGYVDTDEIVSGKDGWLFNKAEFVSGKCLSDQKIINGLDEIQIIVEMAKAAGIDLLFSVSPDRLWIYPEQLHPRAAAYIGCKLEVSKRWREFKTRAPSLIDHSDVLKPAKGSGDRLYYMTDTHWTPIGKVLAMRQLASIIYDIPYNRLPSPRSAATSEPRDTDLLSRMLLQPSGLAPVLDNTVEAGFAAALPTQKRSALVIHDSFYAIHSFVMQPLFVEIQDVDLHENPEEVYPSVLTARDVVLVNSIERELFNRLGAGIFGMRGQLGRAIIQRNRKAAAACTFPPALDVVTPGAVHLLDGVGAGASLTFALPSGKRPCLRVSLTLDKDARLRVLLPATRAAERKFEMSRAVTMDLGPGFHDIRLVLPSDAAGREVRIVPVDRSEVVANIQAVQGGLIR